MLNDGQGAQTRPFGYLKPEIEETELGRARLRSCVVER